MPYAGIVSSLQFATIGTLLVRPCVFGFVLTCFTDMNSELA